MSTAPRSPLTSSCRRLRPAMFHITVFVSAIVVGSAFGAALAALAKLIALQ